MTKHRDVNKCRRQEKYKMAALIRKLTSGKKRKRERKQQQQFLKRKRRQVMSVSNGTKAGYM